ncbi:MAG TPA: transglutaminase domain-containing protein [Neobacillus sp.]
MMKRDISSFVLYLFGFLLLWEWLRPVEQLTNTHHIGTFILFLLISLLASFFSVKWIWQFLIKGIFILVAINQFHYNVGFFHLSWLKSFMYDLTKNILLVFARNWNDLSGEFRTLLFFILLWIMVYLIHYWLLKRQRIFIFFFMTLIYITVLDTFTPYSARLAIVRTVACGFAVMGMLTYYRIIQKGNVYREPSFIRKWMVPLAGMIVFSVLIGIAAPKAAPIWPDPVPYFTGDTTKGGGGSGNGNGPKTIGYGENDSRLGGPFIANHNPIFMVEATGKNYWKVETKDWYTGKGWIPSGSTPIPFREEDLVPVYSIPEAVDTINETARFSAYKSYQYTHFVYPAGIQKFMAIQPANTEGNLFEIDTTTEKIQLFNKKHNLVVPNLYTIDFKIPKYKANDLKETTEFDPSITNNEFYQRYTQLSDGLPPEIKQLAEDITAEEKNWFDKAKAVERYFSNADYTYDQKNVAYPAQNDDYVYQFLFETKRGYCDNFSTSMAIMLRTIGIPTRWVKGYTGGDFLEYSKENSSKQIYEITNNNAHSWVEVFFPNQGWVPFEPTKGFTNEIIVNYTGDAPSSANNQQTTPPPVKKPQKQQPEDTGKSKDSKKASDTKSLWQDTKLVFKNNWKQMMIILVVFGSIAGVLYRIRGKWVPYLILLFYRFKKNDESLAAAYVTLLNQLDRYGLKRKENQTLRNYAVYVDTFFSSREMTRLTAFYEQYLYHQNLSKGTWKETHELWENLIKKTIA